MLNNLKRDVFGGRPLKIYRNRTDSLKVNNASYLVAYPLHALNASSRRPTDITTPSHSSFVTLFRACTAPSFSSCCFFVGRGRGSPFKEVTCCSIGLRCGDWLVLYHEALDASDLSLLTVYCSIPCYCCDSHVHFCVVCVSG